MYSPACPQNRHSKNYSSNLNNYLGSTNNISKPFPSQPGNFFLARISELLDPLLLSSAKIPFCLKTIGFARPVRQLSRDRSRPISIITLCSKRAPEARPCRDPEQSNTSGSQTTPRTSPACGRWARTPRPSPSLPAWPQTRLAKTLPAPPAATQGLRIQEGDIRAAPAS